MEAYYLKALELMIEGKSVEFTDSGKEWLLQNANSQSGDFYINAIETDILRIWSEDNSEVFDMEYNDILL